MTFRSRKLLDVAHEAPCFLRLRRCVSGVNPSVPAHSNMQRHGRGVGHKSADCFAVPACPACHYELDYGKNMSREEKEQAWELAFERYQLWLWENEKIRVA